MCRRHSFWSPWPTIIVRHTRPAARRPQLRRPSMGTLRAKRRTMPNTSATATAKPPIVLIHGLWMTALSWEHWVERYRTRGYEVIAKSWPGMDGDIAALRADPSAIDHLGIGEVVEHYERIITALPEKPIIIGHSFGALITQVLLDLGLGRAGVSIDSAPIKGVYRLPWSALRSAFPALKNPANIHRAVTLTP